MILILMVATSDNYHPRLCKAWCIRRIAVRVTEIHLQSQHLRRMVKLVDSAICNRMAGLISGYRYGRLEKLAKE
jgi:hypothetical protein